MIDQVEFAGQCCQVNAEPQAESEIGHVLWPILSGAERFG